MVMTLHVSTYEKLERAISYMPPNLIFLVGFAFFITGQTDREFIGFETRFVLFAQEMLRNGPSLFPTAYGHPYPDYPATQTFLIYLFSLLGGKLTPTSAVMPSAIASALTLAITYLIGAVHSRRWGVYAVLFKLLTYQFLVSARSVALDPFVTLTTATAFYLAYSGKMENRLSRECLAPLAMVAGLVFRGPIGLILSATPVWVFYLLEKDVKGLLWVSLTAAVALTAGTGILLAAALHQGGNAFLLDVVNAQVLGRLIDPGGHPPFYNYFMQALANMAFGFPAALLVLGLYAQAMSRTDVAAELRLLRHLAGWMFILIIGLSIPAEQKIRYLSPIIPAASLLAAYMFAAPSRRLNENYARTTLCGFGYAAPVIGLALVAALLGPDRWRMYIVDSRYAAAIALFAVEAVGSIAILYWKNIRPARADLGMLMAVVAFLTGYATIVEPVRTRLHPVSPFVAQVEANRTPEQEIVFYKMKADGAAMKFVVALDKPVPTAFVQTPRQILAQQSPAVFIAEKSDFETLPPDVRRRVRVFLEADLARTRSVAFVTIQ